MDIVERLHHEEFSILTVKSPAISWHNMTKLLRDILIKVVFSLVEAFANKLVINPQVYKSS